MAIERAVVKATLLSITQTRSMFTCDVLPSGGDTSEVLWDAYLDSFYSPLLAQVTTGWVAYSYDIQTLTLGHWVTTAEVAASWTGTLAGENLPNAVAYVLVGKALGLRKMGRKFISGVTENSNVGNAIASGVMSALVSTLTAYITPFTGIGGGVITPGIVDHLGVFHPFVGGIVSSLLGSMRRRKPGVGM